MEANSNWIFAIVFDSGILINPEELKTYYLNASAVLAILLLKESSDGKMLHCEKILNVPKNKLEDDFQAFFNQLEELTSENSQNFISKIVTDKSVEDFLENLEGIEDYEYDAPKVEKQDEILTVRAAPTETAAFQNLAANNPALADWVEQNIYPNYPNLFSWLFG